MTRLRIPKAAIIAAAILPALSVSAEISATQAFTTAPLKAMPLLTENDRLDMIDYFNSNMSNTTSNRYGGQSAITSLSPELITARLTDASECQLAILPDGKEGLIALISTVKTPVPDSNMKIFSADWQRDLTASVFKAPVLTDWLTAEGKKHRAEVESTVPFLLVSYTYDPATTTLSLVNNTSSMLGKEVYEPVAKWIAPRLDYKFNGKRFVAVR